MAMMASSPYEKHVTMVIGCMSTCAFAIIAMGVVEFSLFMLIAAAEHVKPACPYSLLFHACFAVVTCLLVNVALGLMKQFASADAMTSKLLAPDIAATVVIPETQTAVKFVKHDNSKLDDIVKLVLALKKSHQETTSHKEKKDPSLLTANDSATITASTTTPEPAITKPPSPPPSECSQADTEICKAAKE